MSKLKSGRFSSSLTDREKIIQDMVKRDLDWMSTGGKIWVRCWETPQEFTVVEADVVWTSKMYAVAK